MASRKHLFCLCTECVSCGGVLLSPESQRMPGSATGMGCCCGLQLARVGPRLRGAAGWSSLAIGAGQPGILRGPISAQQCYENRTTVQSFQKVGPTPQCALQVGPLPHWAWKADHQIKEDYYGTLMSNRICALGFWTRSGPVAPFFSPLFPIWNVNIHPMSILALYFGST